MSFLSGPQSDQLNGVARNFYIDSQPPGSQLRINYAAELNPQQCQAVMATAGPALVIAGAGSGKTRTLVYRVAFLIEQGIAPDRILLLTFTNKAAHEMMRRASDLLGMETRGLCGGTFHSIGARMLRQNAAKAGLQPDFTILDREDSRDMIKAVLGARKEDDRESMFPKPDALLDLFSLAVNKHPTLREAIDREYPQFLHIADEISSVHKAFNDRKRAANVVDFDDLLSAWLHLLETQTDVRERYQDQFLYILVDEYQDTNTVQGRIVDLLAARRKNLMVVGDDSQSIYSWRGANSRNLLEFPSRYPGASIYKIETNYRSTPEILNLANAIFASTPQPFAKKLNSSRPSGMRPAVAEAEDCLMQAAFVGMRVLQLREEGVSLNQIAVLYRSHFHTLDLQLELTRRRIPFTITSGLRFFEQAHVKDVCAFLRLMANPRDELSFKRLATMLPGI
ncbi:MAG: ATP-dependent helicase, partial [Verrucomicrobia bacterium]|nr:ATP-dependent helicase [Verrucomicrobiota bacterium]